jgi:hypothetical protein
MIQQMAFVRTTVHSLPTSIYLLPELLSEIGQTDTTDAFDTGSSHRRGKVSRRGDCPDPHPEDPTPETIASLCREIQSSWSPAERERRRVTRPVARCEIRTVRVADMPLAGRSQGL